MYEFHGWIALAETSQEIDEGGLEQKIVRLQTLLDTLDFSPSIAHIVIHNGRCTLSLHAYPNRRRSEADNLRELIEHIVESMPGSYGIVYERDEQWELPHGRGLFCALVVKKGRWHIALDPFLSPNIPQIEDA
ncbi:MAG TPA: Imm7 family immunity protein [Tahibacter sp.]|nr:Imm7 family immunity protein [Tahibacter sp.]